MMLAPTVLFFSLALWLGAYLIGRNPRDTRLLLAGAGLIAYAVALALDALAISAEPSQAAALRRLQQPILFLPVICWAILLLLLLRGGNLHSRIQAHPKPLALLIAITIFFGLGVGLLLLPIEGLPHNYMILAIGFDLLALGVVVALLDAFDLGESLLPDFLRSLVYAVGLALLFGGQVVVGMRLATGVTLAMVALLLGIIASAEIVVIFATPLQRLLDRLALASFPTVRQRRNEQRVSAEADLRRSPTLDLMQLDEEAFTRLTRRALAQMGNLPRLAASPLTHLPQLNSQLDDRDDTLARAKALRALLAESIARLKPDLAEDFATTDEWRFYNALYFPYVAGLKPYSRRNDYANGSDSAEGQAIDWFRSTVPQRTLYNWQNAGAKLIAQDLREHASAKLGKTV